MGYLSDVHHRNVFTINTSFRTMYIVPQNTNFILSNNNKTRNTQRHLYNSSLNSALIDPFVNETISNNDQDVVVEVTSPVTCTN